MNKTRTPREADMPSLATDLKTDTQVEILEPKRLSGCQAIRCDSCRELRAGDEFEPDSCGICITCLECDDLLVDLSGWVASAPPV
jgi:hypothetical protein